MKRFLECVREHWQITAVLLLFLGWGVAYSVVNPLHEGTDELRHYRFVRYLVENKRLPVQGQEACRSQSHHPPLIYALGALVSGWVETGRGVCDSPEANPFWGYRQWEVGTDNKNMYMHKGAEAWPWRGEALAARLVRFVNVLVGAGTVWLTYLVGLAIWPRRNWLAVGGTLFVAFNPMFVYMSGTINNDVMAALSGTAVLYVCVRLLTHLPEKGLSWRWGLAAGGVYALALMSKFNLAPIVALWVLASAVVAQRRGAWGWWARVQAIALAVTLVGAGWWFGRNYYYYGEPTGFETLTTLWGVRTPSESFWLVMQELPNAWSSLWGRFGFGQIPLPQGVYTGLWWLMLVAGAGLLWRGWCEGRRSPLFWPVAMLFLQVGMFFGILFAYMLVSPAGAMGRFFFPGLPALSLLMGYGLAQFLGARGAAVGGAVGMLGLTAVALLGYLAPAYAPPARWDDEAALPNPTRWQFDQFVALRGYEVAQGDIAPGERLTVRLYWEVLNVPVGDYWLFVHLWDEELGSMVAQRDTHPGLGKLPSSEWQVGDRFVDEVSLVVPNVAYPTEARLQVGLYAPGSYRLAVSEEGGTAVGDSVTLADIDVERPRPPLVPHSEDLNFGPYVRLVGYEYSDRELRAGETVTVTLHWEMLQPDLDGQVSQVGLEAAAGEYGRVSDNSLQKRRPETGTRLVEVHEFEVGEEMPAGEYAVLVRLFDIFTGERNVILAEDGHWIDNELELAPIFIDVSN